MITFPGISDLWGGRATSGVVCPRKLAARGVVSLDDYPLLMHVDEIINQGAEVNIPWEKFTMFVE